MKTCDAKSVDKLVSVIVPCYNQAKYLPEALQSVLMQSYSDWECIIVNDGSTDNTEDVALKWVKNNERFRYINKINGGLSSARNKGLSVINGEYVQFLDADDFIHKDKFKLSLEAIGKSTPTLVISDFIVLDEISNTMRPSWWCDLNKIKFSFQSILLEWDISFTIPIHCGIFPAFYFNDIRFDETLGAKEDWLMWLVIFKQFHPNVLYLNKPLAIYRYNFFNMTKNYNFMYSNINKAFDSVYVEFVDEHNKTSYFKKVNDYWYKQCQYSEERNQKILRSRVYKFSERIGRPIRYFRDLLNRDIRKK